MSVEYKDYYKILGVSKDVAQEHLAKAFKKLARKYHPDLNPDKKEESERKFKEINEAYEVLKDPEKRRLYDSLGANWQQGQNFQPPPGFENVRFNFGGGQQGGFDAGGFSDFFETIFGGAAGGGRGRQARGGGFGGFGGFEGGGFQERPARGGDIEATVELTLEEAFHGGSKPIALQDYEVGPAGRSSPQSRTLQVNIPAGIKAGQRVRLAGQGNKGAAGGPAGDLFLRVAIRPHSRFKVEDTTIVYDLPLAPWEAALGAKVRVPTLEGEVEMTIPPGISSGRKLRIRGKGLGSEARKGDQLVRVMIQSPKTLTDEERELWERLARLSGQPSGAADGASRPDGPGA